MSKYLRFISFTAINIYCHCIRCEPIKYCSFHLPLSMKAAHIQTVYCMNFANVNGKNASTATCKLFNSLCELTCQFIENQPFILLQIISIFIVFFMRFTNIRRFMDQMLYRNTYGVRILGKCRSDMAIDKYRLANAIAVWNQSFHKIKSKDSGSVNDEGQNAF